MPKDDEARFRDLMAAALPLYKGADSAHDQGHAMRVLKLAEVIGKAEGANLSVLRPAALLHDIGCAPKHLGKEKESEDRTLIIARALLAKTGYGPQDIETILGMIGVHGYSRKIVPKDLEGKILQDADRLDAMGAIGIARTFLVGGSINRPLYHLTDPWAKARDIDDKAYNLDHFEKKLLKLKDGMHTGTARSLAQDRHKFLEKYIEQMKKELES
jgi:uncharacterized protein